MHISADFNDGRPTLSMLLEFFEVSQVEKEAF